MADDITIRSATPEDAAGQNVLGDEVVGHFSRVPDARGVSSALLVFA